MNEVLKRSVFSAFLALGASGVQAAIVTATYSGTINEGASSGDYFGTGVGMNGLPYLLVFQYDTAIGGLSGPGLDQVFGGTSVLTPGHGMSPMLSAALTIGSVTHYFGVGGYGEATAFNDGTSSYTYHQAGVITDGLYVAILGQESQPGIVPDIEAPQDFSPENLPNELFTFDQGSFGVNEGTTGYFSVDRVRITVAAVPLPGTLPLFAVALLGLGWLRRRSCA